MYTVSNLFMDFALMSIILCIAHLIRYWVRPFQLLYIPTSIIAGFIGLFGGYQFLNVLPFATKAEGAAPFMASYPGLLTVVLFGTLFLGKTGKNMSMRKMFYNVQDTLWNATSIQVLSYGVAMLFGYFILMPMFPALHKGFAILEPAGFMGGHGVATAIGSTLEKYGWDDAMTVGYTFATSGLLIGLIGGLILINIATRKGWTRLVKSPKELPKYMMTGFIPLEKRKSVLEEDTVPSIALESFSWHFALVMSAYAIGFYVIVWIKKIFPGNYEIPHFATAMLAGFLIQKVLDILRLGQYVNSHVSGKIGSWVTDYLVAFAVATIRISVVVKYAVPLIIMFLVGVAFTTIWLLWVGPRIYHNFWFERSIFIYGMATGVVATGVTLLRVVDPQLKSKTLEDYGIAYVFYCFITILIPVFIPMLVMQGATLITAIFMSISGVICLLISKYTVGWFSNVPLNQFREDEANIIEGE